MNGLTNWFPGHYIQLGHDDVATVLAQPGLIAPFAGLQVEYDWWTVEGAEGDYDAGFQALDHDLAAVADAGKKLVITMSYKNFSGNYAVPGYLLDAGPWCEKVSDGGFECGQFNMDNGVTAMVWQGLDAGGVADRVQAWVQATGAHAAAGPYASVVAGMTFPESACSGCASDVGYSDDAYLAGLEGDVLAGGAGFPGAPIFQYINFMTGGTTATQAGLLEQYAVWAQAHPFAGAGCPDVAPLPYPNPPGRPTYSDGGVCTTAALYHSPPGYSVLIDAGAQGLIPFDVAIEYQDYTSCATPSILATYDTAILPAPAGMAAQYVAWADFPDSVHLLFGLPDVAAFLSDAGPFPNAAPPTW